MGPCGTDRWNIGRHLTSGPISFPAQESTLETTTDVQTRWKDMRKLIARMPGCSPHEVEILKTGTAYRPNLLITHTPMMLDSAMNNITATQIEMCVHQSATTHREETDPHKNDTRVRTRTIELRDQPLDAADPDPADLE